MPMTVAQMLERAYDRGFAASYGTWHGGADCLAQKSPAYQENKRTHLSELAFEILDDIAGGK